MNEEEKYIAEQGDSLRGCKAILIYGLISVAIIALLIILL